MTPAEALNMFRLEMADTEAPYLWADAEVKAYIEDAQTMFYRLVGGRDDSSTQAICEITVAPGDEWAALDPRILKIKGAYRRDTGAPLQVLNYEDLEGRGIRLSSSEGSVRGLILGMDQHRARLLPISNESTTIKLAVKRLPLTPVFHSNPLDSAFELEERHHLALLSWVKRCAYIKQDAETFDRTRAKEFDDAFRSYCDEVVAEWARERHKPRAVMYGGY